MFEIILFLIFWIACGVVACGFCFATEQRPYDLILRMVFFEGDQKFSFQLLLLGTPALIAMLLFGSSHGWLWPWGAKAREEAGII